MTFYSMLLHTSLIVYQVYRAPIQKLNLKKSYEVIGSAIITPTFHMEKQLEEGKRASGRPPLLACAPMASAMPVVTQTAVLKLGVCGSR